MLRQRRQFKWTLEDTKIKYHSQHNRDMIWESQNGKQTMIMDMDSNHLKNCLAKIKRENWRKDYLEILELELIYRQLYQKQENNGRRNRI